MLFQKLKESGIHYLPADFKAEVHFLGQIVGVSNIIEYDGVFLEAYFQAAEHWRFLTHPKLIQTQTAYVNYNHFACFCHPFDCHLTTENIHGWPRLIIRLWKLGDTNKVDLLSYGTVLMPNTSGFHELEFDTWELTGGLIPETIGFFTQSKPMMNGSDPVNSNLEDRTNIVAKPGPKVHINVEVILRNFTFHSLSGPNNGITQDGLEE